MTNRIALWRDAPDADSAAALAALLDWASVIIEVSDGGGREGFFSAAAGAFGFPEYFGENWDAFEEVLSSQEFDEADDLDDAQGLLILWSNWADLAISEPDQFATAIEVFRDVLGAWAGDDLAARVVLLGEGPHFSLAQPAAEADSELGDDDLEDDEEPDEESVGAPAAGQ